MTRHSLSLLLLTFLLVIFHSNAQNTKIPIKDLSNQRLEVGTVYAQKYSGSQIILHYMGSDKALMKTVYKALSKAKSEGAPVGGMIISPPNVDFQYGTECYQYYLQGICLDKEPVDANLKTSWLVYKSAMLTDSMFFKNPVEE